MSSKRSRWEGKGQQPLLPIVDPREGAQLGAAETPEAFPLLLVYLWLEMSRAGWLAWEDQGRVWGEGQ